MGFAVRPGERGGQAWHVLLRRPPSLKGAAENPAFMFYMDPQSLIKRSVLSTETVSVTVKFQVKWV